MAAPSTDAAFGVVVLDAVWRWTPTGWVYGYWTGSDTPLADAWVTIDEDTVAGGVVADALEAFGKPAQAGGEAAQDVADVAKKGFGTVGILGAVVLAMLATSRR